MSRIPSSLNPPSRSNGACCSHSNHAPLITATRQIANSRITVERLVRVRMAPMNAFQPSATGNECKRARSRGSKAFGARRACTRARMSASVLVLVGGGSGTYGRRIVGLMGGVGVKVSSGWASLYILPRSPASEDVRCSYRQAAGMHFGPES